MLAFHHLVQNGTGAIQHSPKVYGDHFFPLISGFLHKQLIDGPAHVVNQDIHLSKFIGGSFNHLLYEVVIGHIRLNKERFGAHIVDLLCNCIPLTFVQFRHYNPGFFFCEAMTDGATNIRTSTCNDNRFSA